MKSFLPIVVFLLLRLVSVAQLPQAINFQAIARNSNGEILVSTPVAFRLSILEGSANGALLYQEEHNDTTNKFGSLSLQIGQGEKTGASPMNFKDIPWNTGSKFLNIKIDTKVVRTWDTDLGTIQLLTVPFAFAAGALTSMNDKTAKDGDFLVRKAGQWVPGTPVPTGTILAYAGDESSVPDGWLLCDGRPLKDSGIYQSLFKIIRTYWGNGSGTGDFNLPDLRGVFLRGVDGIAGKDPDKQNRNALKPGGNTGNNVGSLQEDEIRAHNHPTKFYLKHNQYQLYTGSGAKDVIEISTSNNLTTENTGGTETRPKNVYVNYIIKL